MEIYSDQGMLCLLSELLFLTAIILIIILFTYYLININKIVRTISSNYYWGKEFEKTYESFENRSDINEGFGYRKEVIDKKPVFDSNQKGYDRVALTPTHFNNK